MTHTRANGTPPTTNAAVLKELRRLKLLTGAVTARVEASALAGEGPDQALREALVDAGLTPFQVSALFSGEGRRLRFGSYVLLDKLGEGGMGVVYRVTQTRLNRTEALKLLRADKAGSGTVLRRFLREIELTSSLEHPNIVRAYDAGRVGGQLYLATEFINGTDLSTFVQSHGPMTVADACLVVYQTALALQHVHERGLVHRDLKPSNLIRDRATGVVKVLDMGLSGFSRSMLEPGTDAALTRDGVVLGTPDFMAPEQVQDPHGVDIRADLYSLGCTFHFLLTGKPPYGGTPVEKMYFHGFAPPPVLVLPSGLVPPPGLAEIVERLMAKKPDDRYRTPQELIDALLAIRPGAAGNPSKTLGYLVAAPKPPQVQTLTDGAFDHLLSKSGSTVDVPIVKEDVAEPRGGWVKGILLMVCLFLVGFLAAALLVS